MPYRARQGTPRIPRSNWCDDVDGASRPCRSFLPTISAIVLIMDCWDVAGNPPIIVLLSELVFGGKGEYTPRTNSFLRRCGGISSPF